MKTITSKDNQIYKLAGKLASRKYRDQYGRYLVEGEKQVAEAFAAGQPVQTIIAAEGHSVPGDLPCETVFMEAGLFSKLAQTMTSQGILAIIEKRDRSRKEFLAAMKKKSGNVVLLDRLQDPGNIGTIIRTADAAGYSGVMTIKGTADIFSPKIVRAAAGSLFRMPVFAADSPREAVSLLEEAGKTILATGFDTDKYYYQVEMKQDIGLIIGNEGNGISDELMQMAHTIVKIPMDECVDSLNAAVAAGILMYESHR